MLVIPPGGISTVVPTISTGPCGSFKGWPDTVVEVRAICVLTELDLPAAAVGALLAPGAATTASAMTKKAWRITSPPACRPQSMQNGAARHIAHGCSPT